MNGIAISRLPPVFEATDALLSRTKWSITANVNNGNARNAIDNNVSTRWDTGQSQKAGQMVTVNMNAANKLNRIILDSSKSPGDGPAGYELYVKNGANADWKLVAEGKNGTSVLIIGFPEETATHFKIIQRGRKGGYFLSPSVGRFITKVYHLKHEIRERRDVLLFVGWVGGG